MQKDASDGAETTTSFSGFKAERFILIHAVGSFWVSLWLCSTQFSLQTRQMEESQVGTSLIVVTEERSSEIKRISCQQSNSPLMSQTFNMVPPATHLPVHETQETWVQSLGQEDPLEQEMITHSSILAWEILCTEEPGGLQSMGSQRVRHDCACMHTCIHPITEGRAGK